MKVQLGDRVKDRISGLEGIATGRAEYLYGEARVQVTPAVASDGKPVDGTWLDEAQLNVTESEAMKRA